MKKAVGIIGLTLVLALGAVAAESRCPLIPMGAITGKPDEQTVKETLEAFKSVGIDQYLIYARSGLEYDYMGEDWLRMCEQFCKHAKRLDMKIWLYDEYNWPSGSCRGRVPAENPDFESRQYAVFKNSGGDYAWQVVHSPGWVDNYSFKAMARFIEMTHKVYEKRLGPYLGNTVAGIFTDEPAHPTPVSLSRKPALLFRHFDGAEAEYKAATGRELKADVEAYLADKTKDEVWSVYYGLLGERFRKAYFDQIRVWCDRVGVFATGHMISENDTCNSSLYNGNPLHALKGLSLPGMDEIGTRLETNQIEWLTLAIAQHAITRRGNGGLAELFALGPSDMTHATQRQMIWLCALHKVDHYVLAISPIDARGNADKAGYFNPISPMQPWFPALRLLGDDARLAARFAAKPVACDIAIRYPQCEAARLTAQRKSQPILLTALRRFSENQLTYDLYEATEPCDKPLVFAFDGTTMKEEKSGRTFASPDEAAAFAKSAQPPAVWVETADGKPDEELLVRRYLDGSVAVLALGGREHGRLRLMRRGDEPMPFDLPARGVWAWDGKSAMSAPAEETALAAPVPVDLTLALSSPDTYRFTFGSNGVAHIQTAQALDNVTFAVRDFPKPSRVTLDGLPVTTDSPCVVLRPGLNGLYTQSAPLKLAAGEHTLTIAAGGGDTNYFLPVAWATGNFVVREGALAPKPATAAAFGALWRQGLGGYAGRADYTMAVEVPAGKGELRLRLQTGGLYTSASLDGLPLGERAWVPFEWAVPERCRGKRAELKVSVWTSVAPLFGDWRAPDAAWCKKFWVPPPEPTPEIGLLSAPEWLAP